MDMNEALVVLARAVYQGGPLPVDTLRSVQDGLAGDTNSALAALEARVADLEGGDTTPTQDPALEGRLCALETQVDQMWRALTGKPYQAGDRLPGLD